MKIIRLFPLAFFLVFGWVGSPLLRAGPTDPSAACTYECAGLYWTIPESGPCTVRYRESTNGTWREGLPLIYDSRDSQYRGSIVGLKPGTSYQVELSTKSTQAGLGFETRSDRFKVGRTTALPEGESDQPVIITESGTPDAYHLVTVPNGGRSVLNLKNVYPNGIEIDADYVILDGIDIRNAAENGVLIRAGHHDVVVQRCHVSFWGRIGGAKSFGNFVGNLDAGIRAANGTFNLTIQRNLIENPRGASNDWESGHPTGPEAIAVLQSRGGNVIRYNDLISTEDHGFNDAIGGEVNFSDAGNMNRDSDIHGNCIVSVWDDGIECEGANMNVRIWGNYLERYFNGIATAATHRGPIYMFRNVFATSRRSRRDTLGSLMFKCENNRGFGGGRRFIFHNTAVQPNGPYGAVGHNPNCVTRNNAFDVPGQLGPETEADGVSDFDYDYFSGLAQFIATEPHRINAERPHHRGPLFVPSRRLEFFPLPRITNVAEGVSRVTFGTEKKVVNGLVQELPNPLIDSGVRLPGFNDDFAGAAPDVGAFETGRPPLEFGRRAYLGRDEDLAPWER